jgi:anti-sigma factor RsiW
MDEIPVTEAELQAYVDGRLPEARRADVEAYLAARPEEASRIAAYGSQREALRDLYAEVLDEPLPERLVRAAEGARSAARTRMLRWGMAAGCAMVALAVGGMAGWQLHAWNSPTARGTTGIARQAAVAHATYSPEVRHPVEVGADQEAHLVAWLSKRLGGSVRAPRLAGFPLVGGRLLPGESGPVAQFMYQHESGRRLTLYVRNEPGASGETAFRYAREGKIGVFYWIDRGFGYALSGELEREDLYAVASQVYRQLNP